MEFIREDRYDNLISHLILPVQSVEKRESFLNNTVILVVVMTKAGSSIVARICIGGKEWV